MSVAIAGDGSYGIVYIQKASDFERKTLGWPMLVARKVATGEAAVEALENEAKSYLELKSVPGILPLRAVLFGKNTASITIDYVPLPLHQTKGSGINIRHTISQILETLAWMHSRRVIHGDLKPANILYSVEQKRVYIIDFGMSFKYDEQPAYPFQTPEFRAPEVWEAISEDTPAYFDGSVDVWSVGIILAHMLLGWTRFTSFKADQYLYKEVFREMEKAGLKDTTSYSLLRSLLITEHRLRPSANKAREHPFFSDVSPVDDPGQKGLQK